MLMQLSDTMSAGNVMASVSTSRWLVPGPDFPSLIGFHGPVCSANSIVSNICQNKDEKYLYVVLAKRVAVTIGLHDVVYALSSWYKGPSTSDTLYLTTGGSFSFVLTFIQDASQTILGLYTMAWLYIFRLVSLGKCRPSSPVY